MNDDFEIRLEKTFRETLGIDAVSARLSQKTSSKWDSIGHLNLILALEAEFGVAFEPEEIAEMRTFEDVRKMLSEKMPH